MKGFNLKQTLCCLLVWGVFFSSQSQPAGFAVSDFQAPDSIASHYFGHAIDDLRQLSYKLTGSLTTDLEKFRAIYKWVCDNVANDYGLYARNKHMRERFHEQPVKLKEWNKKFHSKVVDKLVKEQKTVCTGYAYLIKDLAYHAHITCEVVDGYGRTAHANIGGEGIPNHSWNAVRIDNKWYLCDATWSSGSVDPTGSGFIRSFSEAYFLTDPDQFIQNHYPLDRQWMLLEDPPTLTAFLNGPLIYKSALAYGIVPVSPDVFKPKVKKGETLTFRFASEKELQGLEVKVDDTSGSMDTFQPDVYRDKKGHYCIDYVFSSKGAYDVHFLKSGEYLATYAVTSVK
ncbi:MAG: transglutaminase domain-containing protein [Bacteroidota bacterium]